MEKGNVRIALCGMENQTVVDAFMPMRVIGYDGQSYRKELLTSKRKMNPYFPVETLVLYFGTKRWNKPRTLYECIRIRDELKPFVNDYRINLFEIAFLPYEIASRFKSDFRFVVDYFIQIRKNNNYKASKEEMCHVDEILKMMSVLTHDDRFIEVQNLEGGVHSMCDVLDRAEEKGIQEGKQKGKIELLVSLVNEQLLSIMDAAKKAGMSEQELKKLL